MKIGKNRCEESAREQRRRHQQHCSREYCVADHNTVGDIILRGRFVVDTAAWRCLSGFRSRDVVFDEQLSMDRGAPLLAMPPPRAALFLEIIVLE